MIPRRPENWSSRRAGDNFKDLTVETKLMSKMIITMTTTLTMIAAPALAEQSAIRAYEDMMAEALDEYAAERAREPQGCRAPAVGAFCA